MWLKQRSNQLEWMDEGLAHITLTQYHDALRKLDRVGRLLGGDKVIYKELTHLEKRPESIIDVGCGGGQLALRLARKYPHTKIIGLDIDREAIAFANKEHAPLPHNLSFALCDKQRVSDYLTGCSVIISSLVCHHLTDHELIQFLVEAKQKATQAIILNDLQRHCLAYASYYCLSPIMFQNRMIFHDGLISIKRAFQRQDWVRLMSQAKIKHRDYSVRWYFPFRWGVHIRCQ